MDFKSECIVVIAMVSLVPRPKEEEEEEEKGTGFSHLHMLNYQWKDANDAFKDTWLILWRRYPMFQTSLAS